MQTSLSMLPDVQTLTVGLTSVLSGRGAIDGQVTILHRQPNFHGGVCRSEIVTCRLANGSERLFCKYEARDSQSWSDVAYEAEVYRHVLEPSRVSGPRFYGAYTEVPTGRTWLILEYLENSTLLRTILDPDAIGLAARWLGRFHAATEARLSSGPMPFLKVYDAEYYFGFARRVVQFAGSFQQRFSWLSSLCKRFQEFAAALWSFPPAVTHSDYYPHNILFRDGTVYPIDWEHAGIDVGEMDLASLTDGQPAEIEQQCEREYYRARWPEGSSADFERRLSAARLCLHFYKLDRPDWTTDEKSVSRSERLRSLSKRLGLI